MFSPLEVRRESVCSQGGLWVILKKFPHISWGRNLSDSKKLVSKKPSRRPRSLRTIHPPQNLILVFVSFRFVGIPGELGIEAKKFLPLAAGVCVQAWKQEFISCKRLKPHNAGEITTFHLKATILKDRTMRPNKESLSSNMSTRLIAIATSILLAFSGMVFLGATAPPASAATIPNAITSVELTNSTAPVVQTGTTIKFEGAWEVPDYSSPGDTFSLILPKELGWKGGTSFPLNNASGDPVAVANVALESDGRYVVTFTLSPLVAMKPLDVSGTFFFWTQWRVDVDEDDGYTPGDTELHFETNGTLLTNPPVVVIPNPQPPGPTGAPTTDPVDTTPSDMVRKGFTDWEGGPAGTLPGEPGTGPADPTKTPLENAQELGGDYLLSPDIPSSWGKPHYAHVNVWGSPAMPEDGTLTMIEKPGPGIVIDCYTTLLSDSQLRGLYGEEPAGALFNPSLSPRQLRYWHPTSMNYVAGNQFRTGKWLVDKYSPNTWTSAWTRGVQLVTNGPWGDVPPVQYSQGVYTEVNHTGKVTTTCDTNTNTLTVVFQDLPKGYAVELGDISFVLDPNFTDAEYENFSSAIISIPGKPDLPYEQIYSAKVTNYNSGGTGSGTAAEYENTIVVEKRDSSTGALTDGALFNIYDANGELLASDLSTTNGRLTFTANSSQQVSSTYYVKESVAPPGYSLNPDLFKVVVRADDTETVVVENEASGSVTINKVDGVTGDPLVGAEFTIHYDSSNSPGAPVLETVDGASVPVRLTPTGAQASASYAGLAPGIYWLTEVVTPDGYEVPTAPTRVTVTTGGNTQVEVENAPVTPPTQYGTVTISKTDGVNPLSGAVFTITTDVNGAPGSPITQDGTVLTLAPSGPDATVTSPQLVAGQTVWIVETETPSGYQVSAPQKVTVNANKDTAVTVVNTQSPQVGTFTLSKTDGQQPLLGAEFTVHHPNGDDTGPGLPLLDGAQPLVLVPNGSDATVTSPELNVGPYYLVETKTPEGYTPTGPARVEVGESLNVAVTITNTPIPVPGTITINKTDGAVPLDGAVFTVMHDEGGAVGEPVLVSGAPLTLTPTGSAATVTSPALSDGVYWLVETTTPNGYDTAEPVMVTVSESNDTTVTIVNDLDTPPRQPGSLALSKVDSDTKLPLDGAVFSVHTDNSGAPGPQFTTLVEGQATPVILSPTGSTATVSVSDLPPGEYWIIEVNAPEGYTTAEPIKFTIIDSQTTTLVVENQLEVDPVIHEPRVDIEKFDLLQGDNGDPTEPQRKGADFRGDADTSERGRDLDLVSDSNDGQQRTAHTQLKFVVTNTGNEPLVNVRIWDETVSGVGVVDIETCYVTADKSVLLTKADPTEPATHDNPWLFEGVPDPLEIGGTITCEGVLEPLNPGATHANKGYVLAQGALSGLTRDRLLRDEDSSNDKDLNDEDEWHARAEKVIPPTPTPTPTAPPVESPDPGVVATPTPSSSTPDSGVLSDPVQVPKTRGTVSGGVASSGSELPRTGADQVVSSMVIAVALLAGGIAFVITTRRKQGRQDGGQ